MIFGQQDMYQIEKCGATGAIFSHQRQDFSGEIQGFSRKIQGFSGKTQGVNERIQDFCGQMQGFSGEMQGNGICGDGSVILSTDPKPRLRWTAELHERFVDAVAQLGGADSKFSSTVH